MKTRSTPSWQNKLHASLWRRTLFCLSYLNVMVLLSAGVVACAEPSTDAGDPTSLAVGEQQPQTSGGDPPSTADPATDVPAFTLLPAEAKTGVAVRWQRDTNKCITRKSATPTLYDPLVLSMCADTNAQAWIVHGGSLMADANLCAGANAIGDGLRLFPCTDSNARTWAFNGGAVFAINSTGGLFSDDANGTLGSPIRYSNYAAPDKTLANWNLTGVGARQGSIISWGTSPNLCMSQQGGGLQVNSCALTDVDQRWSLLRGDLAGNGNLCVVGTSPDVGLTMIPCADVSNTSDNNQGWYVHSYIQYASSYGPTKYELSMDAQKQNFVLIPVDRSVLLGRYYWGGRLVPASP